MTTESSERAGMPREWLWLGLILLVTLAVYAKALTNEFTYDDRFYAAAYTMHGPNVMVVGDHPIGDYFERPMGYGIQDRGRGFRPLTVLSYAWTHRAVREKIDPPRRHPSYPENRVMQDWTDPAWPHHLINLLLHVLATFVVYRLLRAFTGPGLPALGGAAVFGLHALHSDPVVSVVGRGELLPFVFGGLGTLLYLGAIGVAAAARWWRLALVAACMLVAFLSKESAIGWVAMTPLCAAVHRSMRGEALRESSRRQAVAWGVAVLLPAVVFIVLRARMMSMAVEAQDFQVGTGNNILFAKSFFERLPTAVMVWGVGLLKLVVPYPLASDYGQEVFDVTGYGDWRFYLAGAAVLGLLILGLQSWRRRPLVFLGMAGILGFSFITSNVPVSIETIFGERLYYTPVLGVSFFAAAALAQSRRVVLVLLGLWLVASSAVCVKRSFDWETNETLWEVDADTHLRSLGLQMNMARVSRLRGDWDARRRYLERALEVDPEYCAALNDLAADLMQEEKFAEALPYLRQAIGALERVGGFDYEIYAQDILINIGVNQIRLGDYAAARRSIERSNAVPGAKRRLGSVYGAYMWLHWLAWQRRDVAGLKSLLAEAEALFPKNVGLQMYHGVLAHHAGDHGRAISVLEKSLPMIGAADQVIVGYEALIAACEAVGCADLSRHRLAHGRALYTEGEYAAARDAFIAVMADPKLRLDAEKGLLWIAWEEGGAAAVGPLLQDALKRTPNDPGLLVHRGMLAQLSGDPATAAQILMRTALRLPPSRGKLRAFYALGEAFVQLRNHDEAAKLFGAMLSDPAVPVEYQKKFRELKVRLARTKG